MLYPETATTTVENAATVTLTVTGMPDRIGRTTVGTTVPYTPSRVVVSSHAVGEEPAVITVSLSGPATDSNDMGWEFWGEFVHDVDRRMPEEIGDLVRSALGLS